MSWYDAAKPHKRNGRRAMQERRARALDRRRANMVEWGKQAAKSTGEVKKRFLRAHAIAEMEVQTLTARL